MSFLVAWTVLHRSSHVLNQFERRSYATQAARQPNAVAQSDLADLRTKLQDVEAKLTAREIALAAAECTLAVSRAWARVWLEAHSSSSALVLCGVVIGCTAKAQQLQSEAADRKNAVSLLEKELEEKVRPTHRM